MGEHKSDIEKELQNEKEENVKEERTSSPLSHPSIQAFRRTEAYCS